MKKKLFFIGAAFLIGALLLIPCQAVSASNPNDIAVVISEQSDRGAFTFREVRKVFLGYPLVRDSRLVVPLINKSDQALYERFVKKMLLMSPQSYERYLISRVLQLGGKSPRVFSTQPELMAYIENNRDAVTHVWLKDAKANGMRMVFQIQTEQLIFN